MSECLKPDEIDRYRKRGFDRLEDLMAADVHINTCDKCRAALRTEANEPTALLSLLSMNGSDGPVHLDNDLILRYVVGDADAIDREIVESHIEDCARCEGAIESLRAFHVEMEATTTAAETSPSRSVSKKLPFRLWWAQLREWIVRPARSSLVFAANAAVLLVFVAALFSQHQEITAVRAQLGETNKALAQSGRLQAERNTVAEMDLTKQVLQMRRELSISQNEYKAAIAALETQSRESGGTQLTLEDNGGIIKLDSHGKMTGLELLAQSDQKAIQHALTWLQLPTPDKLLAKLDPPMGTEIIRGGGSSGLVISKSPSRSTLLTDQPTLSWQEIPEASRYQLELTDLDTNITISRSTTTTHWKSDQPLRRGHQYSWQVVAEQNGKPLSSQPAPIAKFQILDAASAEKLKKTCRTVKHSHLALGVLYSKYGMLIDAEKEFEALERANPDSAQARALVTSVRDLHNKGQ